jgi:hypothetical protein
MADGKSKGIGSMRATTTGTVLTALAIFAGGALAQTSTVPNNPQPKCWDEAANEVRTRTQPAQTKPEDTTQTTVGDGSSEGMSGIEPGTKGSASKTLPGGSQNPTGMSARPPGLPNC